MERTKRIRLSKGAKFVLRLLNNGQYTCPKATPFAVFNDGAHELESNHLAVCHDEECGNVEIARLTDAGKLYISQNPDLRNPVDWKWVITTIIATITAIGTILMVIIGCKVLNH